MPQLPFRDPSLLESVIAERHELAPDAPAPRKAVRKARGDVWDPKANVIGAMWRPMIAPDVAKFTGVPIGTVCSVLIELEAKGRVRKTGGKAAGWDGDLYELWERVVT